VAISPTSWETTQVFAPLCLIISLVVCGEMILVQELKLDHRSAPVLAPGALRGEEIPNPI
jgi:hypothetical protein